MQNLCESLSLLELERKIKLNGVMSTFEFSVTNDKMYYLSYKKIIIC